MSKDERPRGLRARLRQRKARASSEDEVRSRPVSLDLGNRHQPMLHAAAMHSTATMPTARAADTSYCDYGEASQENSGGLALGEFGEDGSEVAEDEEYANSLAQHNGVSGNGTASGAIVRSYSQEHLDQATRPSYSPSLVGSYSHGSSRPLRGRRESSQSVPTYDSTQAAAVGHGMGDSDGSESGGNSGNYSYNYSYDDDGSDRHSHSHSDDDLDAEGELNAVYLKRNTDFHGLFRNIPIDELLIDDYICALQRDILVQGRLYLTENYVCFFSNIFGWVTSLTIAFDEILAMEKKMTALIIPNAIQISTLHAKHAFSSFMYRDSAYNQLYDLWAKSKSERNAGMPEIGHAEDGAGAGDVSKHRADVLNAYQSLTEESGDNSDYSEDVTDEEGSGSNKERMIALGDFEESASSAGDTESDRSHASGKKGPTRQVGADSDITDGSQASTGSRRISITGTGSSTVDADSKAGAWAADKMQQGRSGSSDLAGTNGISDTVLSPIASGSNASPAVSQTGAETMAAATGGASQATVTADAGDVSRGQSQLSALGTKDHTATGSATGTPLVPGSVTSLGSVAGHGSDAGKTPNSATAGSRALLARLPKTPDATDAASTSSLKRTKSTRKQPAESATAPAPATPTVLHKPTTCPCGSDGQTAHYGQEALDAVFPLSLPLLFRLVFSAAIPADVERVYAPADKVDKKELDMSCTKHIVEFGNGDVKTEGWVPDPSDSGLEMCIYSYDKPLGFSIGPKSTVVEDTFRITAMDFSRAVIVEQVVRTPNVPSGTAFFVKIRHCLTWTSGPGNHPPGGWSHYRMTFEVEWVKSSWIKNAIERGTVDSNKQAGEMLEKYIRTWIAANPAMEVRDQPAIGSGSGRAASSAAPRRRARKQKHRDQSPEGLRMEELLGERGGRKRADGAKAGRRRTTDHGDDAKPGHLQGAAGGGTSSAVSASTVLGAAGMEASEGGASRRASDEDEAWKRRAAASWGGWVSYHSVYPVVWVGRQTARTTRAALSGPVSGPVVVAVLVLLLAYSNMWRLPIDLRQDGRAAAGPPSEGVDRIAEVNGRIDVLAEQIVVMNRQLERFVEMHQ